jgi:hypothetical protein
MTFLCPQGSSWALTGKFSPSFTHISKEIFGCVAWLHLGFITRVDALRFVSIKKFNQNSLLNKLHWVWKEIYHKISGGIEVSLTTEYFKRLIVRKKNASLVREVVELRAKWCINDVCLCSAVKLHQSRHFASDLLTLFL